MDKINFKLENLDKAENKFPVSNSHGYDSMTRELVTMIADFIILPEIIMINSIVFQKC